MPNLADFVTIDALARPPGGNLRWRRRLRRALATRPPGLRAATVNHANNLTHALVPRVPPGRALVIAWDSADAAAEAWRGPLRGLLDGAGRFSLDAEVARARFETDGDHRHGCTPNGEGAEPIEAKEPMVALVHGILHPRHLIGFVHNNMHAASRAAHHPGHRAASTSGQHRSSGHRLAGPPGPSSRLSRSLTFPDCLGGGRLSRPCRDAHAHGVSSMVMTTLPWALPCST